MRLVWVVAGLVTLAAIFVGLYIAGPPSQVRALRADLEVLNVMHSVSVRIECDSRPDGLEPEGTAEALLAACDGDASRVWRSRQPRLADGTVRYRWPDGQPLQLCGRFDNLEQALERRPDYPRLPVDAATGCITVDRT